MLLPLAVLAGLVVLAAAPARAQSPQLYAPDGTYLGNLNTNQFDPNSVSNPYGQYGSPYSVDSINNPYGQYGSPYSPNSARNPFGTGGGTVAEARGGHNSSYCSSCARDSHGRIARSPEMREQFMRETGYPHGRPGYVVDHIRPLCHGGADTPANMQWQTRSEARAKDLWECD